MADTKETDRERKEPATKGLHGWKAAATIFGCGTLAAFSVFGVLVGVLSLFVSTASSGVPGASEEPPGLVEQTGQPREVMEPGGLDLCNDYISLDEMTAISIEDEISSSHSDAAEDSGYDPSSQRMASGECSYTVKPQVGTTALWYMDFSFEAIIHDPNGDRDLIASEIYQQEISVVSEEFSVIDSEEALSWADDVQAYYGENEEGVSQYLAVAQSRSAVYKINLSGDPTGAESGQVPENDFKRQAEDLGDRLDGRFFTIIPE
ncbi:hypothetical protein [Nocardiopsis nanhaiensis]